MSDPLLQDEQEAFIQDQTRKFQELVKDGDVEEIEAFLEYLEHEEGYVFAAQALRRKWEMNEEIV